MDANASYALMQNVYQSQSININQFWMQRKNLHSDSENISNIWEFVRVSLLA